MDRSDNKLRFLAVCGLLGCATLLAFWPVTRNQFINFDDPEYVTENARVISGLAWQNLGWAFSTGHAGNWHPLTWLSHMLDCQFHGLAPFWHHLTSLLLHVANSLLAFTALRSLTKSTWKSAFAAALFALHPLRVESVAWVSERKDVLCAFFFFLTLWAYSAFARERMGQPAGDTNSEIPGNLMSEETGKSTRRAWVFYFLALGAFAMGLMSKPMVVTLPCVLLLLDFWPLGRLPLTALRQRQPVLWRLVREKLPFFALAAAASAITCIVQEKQGAVAQRGLGLDSRVGNAIQAYLGYLEKFFWPADLAAFYPHPATVKPALMDWMTWKVPFAALLLTAVTFLAVRWLKRRPYVATGWFWYLGMLVPVIGLIQVGAQAMADRYTYLPSVGLSIILVWGLVEWISALGKTKVPVATMGVVGLGACGVLTWNQSQLWHDNITLFQHALRVTRDNPTAHFNLGAGLELEGQLEPALEQYRLAIAADPFRADAHYNLGHGLAAKGQAADAEKEYRQALEIKPDYVLAHNNLGALLHGQGRYDEAQSHYLEALRLQPDYAIAHANLGRLLADQGKYRDAGEQYREALRLEPNSVAANTGLGLALMVENRVQEALPLFRRVQALRPNDAEACLNLANALYDADQQDEARVFFDKVRQLEPGIANKTLESGTALAAQGQAVPALAKYVLAVRLAPENAEAQQRLGLALAQQGQVGAALTNFLEVVRLRPDAQAHYNLALAYVALNRQAEALPHYRKALELKLDWAVALNDLAWLLATSRDAALRDGREAVQLAEQACKLAGESEPRYWGTLDAAYAEAGRFEEAITTAEKTKTLALASGAKELAEGAERRLEAYRNRRAFHQE